MQCNQQSQHTKMVILARKGQLGPWFHKFMYIILKIWKVGWKRKFWGKTLFVTENMSLGSWDMWLTKNRKPLSHSIKTSHAYNIPRHTNRISLTLVYFGLCYSLVLMKMLQNKIQRPWKWKQIIVLVRYEWAKVSLKRAGNKYQRNLSV